MPIAATTPTFVVTDGTVIVSLRWPEADAAACACHATFVEHARACGTDVGDTDGLFAGLVAPVWWLETVGCVHWPACGCGLSDLTEAYTALRSADSRRACLEEGLAQLRHLDSHRRDAASKAEATCVGCVVEPEGHFDQLDDAFTQLSVALGRLLAEESSLTLAGR